MDSVTPPAFARRKNKDGTFDSICMKCFATIASSLKEPEVEHWEQRHRCDPVALERFNRAKQPSEAQEFKRGRRMQQPD
jgi:hypothetical protein